LAKALFDRCHSLNRAIERALESTIGEMKDEIDAIDVALIRNEKDDYQE